MVNFSLEGKVALVTGAAYGIGFAMAQALAEAGAKIAFNCRTQANMDKALDDYKAIGIDAKGYICDCTDEAGVKAMVADIEKTLGPVDILVNNAGTGAVGPAEEITDEQFRHEMNIDLFGTFVCAREFGKEMIKAQYGRIINIASMYGLVGNKVAPASPYHAAKGGVVNLTRALASEWGKYGITVNSICPGYFYSPLTKETLDSEFFQANARTMIPLERYGNDGELDTAICFLSSPATTYVTGVNLPVDGGYTCM